MRIVIGGSSSAGSSLLKNILGRHSKIFAGSETSLFSKKELFSDFKRNRYRILKRFPRGLKSYAYHMYNGVDLLYDEYRTSTLEIKNIIKDSPKFQLFADRFYEKPLLYYNKEIWIEKTPSNIFLFEEFLGTFQNSKVIHIVRNPYDTIYSMLSRDFSLLRSTGTYLLNNAAGLRVRNHPDYICATYEDLVRNPNVTLRDICAQLGIAFENQMLVPNNPFGIIDTNIASWKNDEMDQVRFEKSEIPLKLQESITFALHSLYTSESGKGFFNISIDGNAELCKTLNYSIQPIENNASLRKALKKELFYDKWHRLIKLYPTGLRYPLEIR